MFEVNEKLWIHNFPFDKPRPSQVEVINKILEGFLNEGKKQYICELPTGEGKSPIAVTIARTLNELAPDPSDDFKTGAYYLTTQKILQQQYLRDFGTGAVAMCELKSATNYDCLHHPDLSCGASRKKLLLVKESKIDPAWKNQCAGYNCRYVQEKSRFLEAKNSITNYAFFMLSMNRTKSGLPARNVLVLDEAHNAPEEICRQIEFEISEKFAAKALELSFLKNADNEVKVATWITETYFFALAAFVAKMAAQVQKYIDADEEVPDELAKRLEQTRNHYGKIEYFKDNYEEDQWVCSFDRRMNGNYITFKPVDAAYWAESYLLGHARFSLLLSATIVDPQIIASQLNLKDGEWGYISTPSSFPKENRPIFVAPVGSMAAKDIDATLPSMAAAIQEILRSHPGEKGIIHTSSFKVAKFLQENIKDKRLLVQMEGNRDLILEKHIKDKKPTVLVSPSMTEGVDLKDHLSRFQIFAKMPYPNLGDRALKKRMLKMKGYYDYLTMRSFVQAVGRSVRHADDSAVTYVLDSCAVAFLRKNKAILPQYIAEAIIWP